MPHEDDAGPGPEFGGDDALYDLYLDACLAGTAEDPAAFCARHGAEAPDLLARLEALRATARAARPRTGPAAAPSPERGLPFERLGEFVLIRRLDAGGMGTVYLARQESLGRDVALKVMRPELSDSPTAVERFRREARALARLRHPNIVAVHAVGEDQGVAYLAMELVPGRTLDDVVAGAASRGETLDAARVLTWGRDLARALASAHGEGVVHRDVKPANIILGDDGARERPLLVDFGIAQDLSGGGPALTRTFAGSPLYAAPEQLTGAPADARVDVYGLGVTLYQCLTGRVPFAGGTMEQVLPRVLAEDPLPPRRLNPAVPRDAETVVLHALAKDPDRRYSSAAELADDLDAVLAGRPIRARPPGARERVVKWCRRRPAPAAATATVVVAAAFAGAFVVSDRAAASADRRRQAAETIANARGLLDVYRRDRESTATLERDAAQLRIEASYRYLSREEDAVSDAKEDAVAAARRSRDGRVYEILDLLRAAEVLDPVTADAEALRAELFREKWREARASQDSGEAAFYRDLVARHDPARRFAAELRGSHAFTLRSDPPGAVVYLYDEREQSEVLPGGEHRFVPVPHSAGDGPAPPVVTPGALALRVVRGAAGIETDDLITSLAGRPVAAAFLVVRGAGGVRRLDRLVSVDGAGVVTRGDLADALGAGDAAKHSDRTFVFERGGATFDVRSTSLRDAGIDVGDAETCAALGGMTATVVHAGVARELELPSGLDVRSTAAPVVLSPSAVAGRTPLTQFEIADGPHLAVLEVPGRPRVRMVFITGENINSEFDVRIPPGEDVPDGFVYVPAASLGRGDVWMMEREVTCAEYLEFLDDPEVRARVDASRETILVPRSEENRRDGGFWRRGADGRFRIADEWRPDWPVIGVSWVDATEYARWRTARAAAQGRREEYRLPTSADWLLAAGSTTRRDYPFGNRFRAKWVKSCFARPRASPEPVRSYPVDESPYGIYDMAGSAFEWVDAWFDESRGLRRQAGGSWAQGEAIRFQLYGGSGAEAGVSSGESGFRLALRLPREAR